jgi:hypothetical protein
MTVAMNLLADLIAHTRAAAGLFRAAPALAVLGPAERVPGLAAIVESLTA